jgi:hypothetical protein
MNEEKMQMEIDRQREEGRFNPKHDGLPESTEEELAEMERINIW